jgi:membrane-bound lytic murein transglycosylase MltF
MRWLLGMVLFGALLIGMASCPGHRERTAETEKAPPEEARPGRVSASATETEHVENTAETRPEHRLLDLVQTPWVGGLDGMLERRLIRVLIIPSRTMYFLERGKPSGLAAEYRDAFETFINKRFPPKARHLKTNVVLVPTTRDDLLPALLDGRGDIAASHLTITRGRKAEVDFSVPTSDQVDEIVVTGPSSPTLTSMDDLAGKEVLARQSSSYWEHLQHLNERFASEGKKPISLVPAPEELQDEDLMEMVNAGLLETIVVDDYKAALWAKILPKIELHPEIVISSGGQFGWMMRKGSPLLEKTVNAFIERHRSGTSFGNTVIRRYLGSTKFVKDATSPTEVKKFDAVLGLFRRYGDRYRLDPLLLMAQGYQESRLNQRARSRGGAVGIMQVRPSTARELKVGDVHQLEPNVHAGVKYIRVIIDTYFADDAVDDLNKTLFAFAAYNAGPNRIRRLRSATRERKLDPDTWFGNVELVVAQRVGAEPVTYVSNIFKYYVAFKLMERHREAQRRAREKFEESVQ